MIHHLQHIVDLVEICRLKGIHQVVISPGSRNAALIRLFASQSEFQLHSIVDERSAAFYGLGIALATKQPVGLLCTSGTAVLNYAPALAEAYYRRIPLIAITADRPEHLVDQQDNQTIRQVNVYKNYVKESIHLHLPIHDEFELEAQHYAIDKILNTAITGLKGPVHINVPIKEPFYIDLPQAAQNIKVKLPAIPDKDDYKELITAWTKAKKILILCGEGNENIALNDLLNTLSKEVVVLAEPISNIKGPTIISAIDRVMINIECNDDTIFEPDLLISFGGPVVSKRLKKWLKNKPDLKHYRVAEDDDHIDTYSNLNGLISGSPLQVFLEIASLTKLVNVEFLNSWKLIYEQNKHTHNKSVKACAYSDLSVFHSIIKELPDDCILHLGNSSPVRYAQLFDLSACYAVYSNRGVSGIDGCLSTAAGYAAQTTKTNIAILGDLSFLYDSNALWNSKLATNLKIIVINNDGGGIFRLIPGPSEIEAFEEFMETKHPVNIEKLVSAYGIEYISVKDENELEGTIQHFMQSKKGPLLLEIKTPRLENAEIFKEYIVRIKNL